jgi:tRNA (cytidine/uridine-2'-O-)-methyltransferase
MADFTIVLHSPQIPNNTGTIGRTVLALNFRLILIKPIAFDLSEKALRRAGLDYWRHVDLTLHEDFDSYLRQERPPKLFFFSKKSQQNYFTAPFSPGSHLVFGNETAGLPEDLLRSHPQDSYFLPILNENVRSLNLSNAVTAVSYEALRKTRYQ